MAISSKYRIRRELQAHFGEADGLPALIIDKFNDYFVATSLSIRY